MNTHQTSQNGGECRPGFTPFAAQCSTLNPQRSAFPPSVAGLVVALAVLLLAGCVAPIGADHVTTRQAYAQMEANALRTGKPSAQTVAILHRYDLDRLAARQPDEAVRQLHHKALAIGDRDMLFALAEMSYVAGERIRHSVTPWDPRDARDYYLGSAVYPACFIRCAME